MSRVIRRALLAAFFVTALSQVSSAQQSMDNASVLKLQSAGLSEDLIVTTINGSPGHYDTSADDMIALKKAGITDKEIGAMIAKNANPNGASAAMPATIVLAAAPPAVPGITDAGVYYKDAKDTWTYIDSENVNFKTGGVLKSAFSDGIVKPDLNGHLTGPGSKLELTSSAEFAVFCMEGQDPGDFQLLHLHTHKDGREFRSVTGGVFHASGGAQRDTIDVTSKKLAPHIYVISAPTRLEPGEYGFLPPMTMNSGKNMASQGKMYTFTIKE